MAKTKHTGFEGQMQDALEQLEVPYNPSHWDELSAKMDAAPSSPRSNRKGWILAAGTALLLSAGAYWMLSDETPVVADHSIETAPAVKEQVTGTKEIASNIESDVKTATPTTPEIAVQEAETSPESTQEVAQIHKANPSNSQKTTVPAKAEEQTADLSEITAPKSPETTKTAEEIQPPTPSEPESDNSAVEPLALITIQASQTTVCPNSPVEFSVHSETNNVSYRWDFGDGQVSNESRPVHQYTSQGNYAVSLTVTDAQGKEHLSAEAISLQVLKAPRIDISTEMPYDLSIDPYTSLKAVSDETVEYQWSLGTQQPSVIGQPTTYGNVESVDYLFNSKGRHPVQLLAVNAEGCQTMVAKTVEVPTDYNLLTPTSFSPTGVNNTWFPRVLQEERFPFVLKIYDRGGREVFSTNQYQPWDGTLAGSTQRAQKGDTYVWIVSTTLKGGKELKFKGTISVAGQ